MGMLETAVELTGCVIRKRNRALNEGSSKEGKTVLAQVGLEQVEIISLKMNDENKNFVKIRKKQF